MSHTFALVIGLLLVSPHTTTHPGHDEVKLLVGQVAGAGDRSVMVDYFDATSMERKTMSLVIDERTKWTLAKKRVQRFALVAGQRVDVLMVAEDLPGGLLQTRAIEIKVKKLPAAAR